MQEIKTTKYIKNLTRTMLREELAEIGVPAYRGDQIFRNLYSNKASSFQDMNDIPFELRTSLAERFEFNAIQGFIKQVSVDQSVKYLFKLADGKSVESVYMPWINDDESIPSRATLCISSQVGCALDCKFCATGTMGFIRNLSTAEIIEQILLVESDLNIKLSNIVFMGMGEPLLNYKAVSNSILIFTDELCPQFSPKKITVSTSGVVPKIKQLATLERPVKLAISLHATTNGVRDMIMPINQKAKIPELMDAVEFYYRTTGMPITYEYIPFQGLNDTIEDAKRLAKIAKRVPSRINIIPFNDISFTQPEGISAKLKPTPMSRIIDFATEIREFGAAVIIRDTFGKDIDAACGQLAISEKSYETALV